MDNLPVILPEQTVVLVIDVQNDFCHPEGTLGPKSKADGENFAQIIEVIEQAIAKFREKSIDIIFIKTVHSKVTDSPSWKARKPNLNGPAICLEGSWGAELCRISPLQKDLMVTKNRYSAFIGTNLDLLLRSQGKQNLIVMGFMANVCVESTVRDGFQYNYSVYAVKDCIGASSFGELEGAMQNIDKYFGCVTDLESLVSILP